jgi:hypothetical protein
MYSLGKLVELVFDDDALGVSSCTSTFGGLLCGFFGADADATTALGGSIVL